MSAAEIIFEVTEDELDGGYCASSLGYSIHTQGDDWEDLKEMVRDAVLCHFDDGAAPKVIRIHLVEEYGRVNPVFDMSKPVTKVDILYCEENEK